MIRGLLAVVAIFYFVYSTYAGIRNGLKMKRKEAEQRKARRALRTDSPEMLESPPPMAFEDDQSEVPQSKVQRQLQQFRQQAIRRPTPAPADSSVAQSGFAAFPTTTAPSQSLRRRRKEPSTLTSAETEIPAPPPQLPVPSVCAIPIQPPAIPQYESSPPPGNTAAVSPTVAPSAPPSVATQRNVPLISAKELIAMLGDRQHVAKIFVLNEIFRSPLQQRPSGADSPTAR